MASDLALNDALWAVAAVASPRNLVELTPKIWRAAAENEKSAYNSSLTCPI